MTPAWSTGAPGAVDSSLLAVRLRWIVGTAALACVVLGVLVLAGWTLDIARLKSVAPGFVEMEAVTALLFVLVGGILWHLRHGHAPSSARRNRFLQGIATLVTLVSATRLGAMLFSPGVGGDHSSAWAMQETLGPDATWYLAPTSELAFATAGLALLLLLRRLPRWRSRALPFLEGAAAIVTVIGATVLLGYAIGVEFGAQRGPVTGGALHAGAAFAVLGTGLFAAAWQGEERLRWAIGGRVTGALLGALVVIMLLMGAAYRSTRDMHEATRRGAVNFVARLHAGQLLSAVQSSEIASQGYALTGDTSFLRERDAARSAVAVAVQQLRSAVGSSPAVRHRLTTIEALVGTDHDASAPITSARRRDPATAARLAQARGGDRRLEGIRAQLMALDAEVAHPAASARAAASAEWAYLLLPLTGVVSLIVLPILVLGLNREVVAHRAAAEAALRSEADFRVAFEHSGIGISLASLDGRFLRVNQRLCDIAGYDRATLEQLRCQDLAHPDDRATNDRLIQEVLQGRITSYALEKRYLRPDGAAVWVNLTVSLVRQANDVPLYFIAAIEDITSRKHLTGQIALSEERFRVAASAASDSIWDWDLATDRIWRSVDLKSRFGYVDDDTTESLGWWMTRVHADDRERLRAELDRALTSPDGAWESEYRFRRADGSYATLHDTGTVLRAPDGAPERMLGSSSDITERTAMAAQLRHAEKMETVGRLAGGIAHDFNNQLAVILGAAEIVAHDLPSDAATHADLSLIRDTAARAADLTRQLLSFSRKELLEPRITSLNEIVASTEPMLRRLIGNHVTIAIQADPEAGSALLDAVQLQQVLMNLAVNGRDAMPLGGTLTITTGNVDLDEDHAAAHEDASVGPHVVLTVSDDGCGMDPETRKHIFDPFFTTKEAGRGTGLGLATVYGIVKQAGGNIWVYSEPGLGTTFKVYFPRVTAAPVSAAPSTQVARTGGQRLILVVDDEPLLRRITARMLEQLGYRVLMAVGGEDALDVLGRHEEPAHLVLTDVFMPGMKGPEAVQRIRAKYPAVKVLFTSGLGDDAIRADGSLTPDAPFISKPFSLAALSQKLQEVLAA